MRSHRYRLVIAALAALLVSSNAVHWAQEPPAAQPIGGLAAAAKDAFNACRAIADAGRGTEEDLYTWSMRWRAAQIMEGRAVADANAEHAARMLQRHHTISAMFERGLQGAGALEFAATKYYWIEADLLEEGTLKQPGPAGVPR